MTFARAIKCATCSKEFSAELVMFECAECGGPLDIVYDYRQVRRQIMPKHFKHEPVSHWKYAPFYPINDLSNVVSLAEGGTPLLESNEHKGLWFKCETLNPTGAFKDRGSTVEISKARELGIRSVACATTGNMGASVATYAARAGIKAHIYVPKFAPEVKLAQIRSTGARVHVAGPTYAHAHKKVRELRKKRHVYLCGDYAYRGEGQKSVAFEIIDQFGWRPPRNIIVPVGNATLLASMHKACEELKVVGLISRIPKIIGVEASGCDPIVKAWRKGACKVVEQKKAKTIASAILCGDPVDAPKALHWLAKHRGEMVSVTDAQIMAARAELGKQGFYVEPSGAVAYAAWRKIQPSGSTAVVLSGHGLKSPL